MSGVDSATTADLVKIYDRFPYPRPQAGADLLHDVSHALSLALRDSRLPGWQVLDAGCGTGHRIVSLALQYPAANFLGIDLSERSLSVARALAREHGAENVEFMVGDLRELSLDRQFDLVICSGILHHLPDPAGGLRALADVLAPDGLIYLWLYHALGEHDRMADRALVRLFAPDSGPDLAVVRALGLRVSADRYGGAIDAGQVGPDVQEVLDADTYLNPIVQPMRFLDLRKLCDGAELDWVSAVGITHHGGGRLLDLGSEVAQPFHMPMSEPFPDPRLLARTADWDNATKLTAIELRLRPTGFSVLAGRGAAMAECEPWVANNLFVGALPTESVASGQAMGDRRRRRMVRTALKPALQALSEELVARYGEAETQRVRAGIDMAIGRRARVLTDPRQRPALFHLPGLPARPWVDPAEYPELALLVESLERGYPAIRAELDELRARRGLDAYVAGEYMNAKFDAPKDGAWSSLTLYADDEVAADVAAQCPTVAAVLRAGAAMWSGSVIVSRVQPGTVLGAHVDDNDYKLTLHLGMQIPAGCGIRVDREVRTWQEGRCLVFSDAYEHEVWNDGQIPRDIVLADIWHPDLSQAEREALREVRRILRPACEPQVFDSF